ncbi:MAG: glycosyltransferase [Pseudomonadota bacterium]
MSRTRLLAVVVTFNRLPALQETLSRLLDLLERDLDRVLVYDNASSDDTAGWLAAQRDPRLTVISASVNSGGAGGFEAAMRAAHSEFDPDWMVLMDDDARPHPATFEAFHARRRDSHDAWAAAVTYPDGAICDMNRPWVNPFGSVGAFVRTLIRQRNGFHMNASAYQGGIRDIDGASFVGLFLSRAALNQAGYPDGRLFLYGDDVLYTLALSKAGGRVAFDPALTFEHDCETLGADATLSPLWKVYYYHRNQVLVYRAAAGPIMFWPVFALRRRVWLRRASAYGANRATYLRLLTLAMADGRVRKLDRAHAEILALSGGTRPQGDTA